MKKRVKASKTSTLYPEAAASIDRPPGAPSDYVSPSPAEILNRLKLINDSDPFPAPQVPTNSFVPQQQSVGDVPSSNPLDDILSRLKKISNGETLPVPTEMPKIQLLPQIGIEFDGLSHIEAPKPDHPIAALEGLQSVEDPEELNADSTKNAAQILCYDQPLGFGLCRAMDYIIRHGIYIEHKGDDEQIIEYRDGEGNLIDIKTAYKYQSHIFSGKRPSEKSRVKTLKKNRLFSNRHNFQVGDTPLHSASTLRNILNEKKQPFIELTGENREILPFEAPVLNLNNGLDKRKKRLKLKTKKKQNKQAINVE